MDLRVSKAQASRFFDGGTDVEPPVPGTRVRIELDRLVDEEGGREEFALRRRIGYRDDHFGQILVPDGFGAFRSDLTSVPTIATWLVPKTGSHLPAALLHDGLVHDPGTPPTYRCDQPVSRVEADRIFRDGMRDTGVGVVRRWLVWSAVTMATMHAARGSGRAVVWLTALVVVGFGVWATLDLFDVAEGRGDLPWMGGQVWWKELGGGAAGAVVIPLLLGFLWGRFRVAGWIAGVSIALLLHVTAAVGLVTGLYQVLEWLAAQRIGQLFLQVALVVVPVAAVVLFVLSWIGAR
jgi:hypothetical protein